ncbi:MAG TPA: ShlB/FhaC/HecB family hemolysin secretion/activation protein [Steroidobacteraceae bacterium]|nr:ShlB/FhaC/HecB family hemolysin secretion/activation protein [Steroidobacteraceae bacterium]
MFGAIAAQGAAPGTLTTVANTAPASATVAASTPLTTSLTTVIVDGSIYAPPQLFATYSASLGRPVTRDGARAILNAIADLYVREGYVRPEVTLDDRLASQGILRAQVYEAHINEVVLEGDSGGFRDELEEIAARLESARPLRRDDVPAALRAMRQFGGLAVSATTRRTAERNAFDLVVQADFSPVDGVVRMNNRGTDQVGPAFVLGQVFANGLFGQGEKLGLIFAAATDHEEYLGGGLFFETPFGTHGSRANALVFHSHSAPNEAPFNLDDEYTRQKITLRITRPLRQDTGLTLAAAAAFEADDLAIERLGERIREDRLRIAEASMRATWPAGATQFSANLQLRHGLDALGAGLDAGELAHDPRRSDFFVTLAQATVYRRFAESWSVRLDAFAQTSGYVLPDSERFKIGGDRLGRGFEVAEIAGDRGLGGKVELRRDIRSTDSLVGRLSTYGFYDIGAAWKQDRPGRDSAATAGIGFAMQGAELTGYLEVAAPFTGPDIEGRRNASVFAELSYRF